MSMSRRGFLVGLPLLLAACSTTTRPTTSTVSMVSAYGPVADEKFPLPGLNARLIQPHLRRQEVAYDTRHPKGSVVIDTPERYLYYVLGEGRAIRYGVGVGR